MTGRSTTFDSYSDDPALLVYARWMLGWVSHMMGKLLTAREHLEIGISLYNPERGQPLISRFGWDAGVYCLAHLAAVLWQLGYPEQALKRSREAFALGQRLSHPFSLTQAELWVSTLGQYRREASAAQESAGSAIALSAEHGFTTYLDWATCLHGWADAAQGRHEEGISKLREGLAALRVKRTYWQVYCLCLLATACLEANRPDEALGALREALATAGKNEEREHEPEIHRLQGEVLLRQNDPEEGRKCFERAIEVARSQSAKSFELRATSSLARLLVSQGNRDEVLTMLAEIYNWFTEGFDTADLKDAKALLDQLSA